MAFQAGSVTAIFQAKIDDFVNKMKGAGKSLEDFGSKGKRLEDQMKSLERRKESLNTKIDQLSQKYKTNTASIEYNTSKIKSYTEGISKQENALSSLSAEKAKYNNLISTNNTRLESLKNKTNEYKDKLKQAETNLKVFNKTVKDKINVSSEDLKQNIILRSEVGNLSDRYSRAKETLKSLTSETKGYGNSIKSINTAINGKNNKLSSLKSNIASLVQQNNKLSISNSTISDKLNTVKGSLSGVTDRIATQSIRMQELSGKLTKSTGLLGTLGGAFSKLGGVAGSVGSTVLGSLTRIGEYIAGNLIANGIGKIANAFVEFGKSAFNSVFNLQDMRGGFEAMLGSADKAKKLLTDLSEYNKKTPFELPQLQEQAGNLLAIGIAADDLIPTMDTLGKISRGNSQRFSLLTLAFGQVKTATKLTGAELRQFTENGVPLLELLAQQTGKTTAQIREDISDGAVSFDMVDRALKSTVQEGGIFYNYFERNSNNFSYVLSNLKDSAMQMGRSILGISESGDILNGSIADLSMQGLQNLLTFVNNNKEAIIDFVKNGIQVGINAFNDFRLNVLPGIILKLQELQAWWQGEGGQAVRDFVSNVWNKAVEGFEKLKNDVIPPLLTEISKIPDKFKEITKWYEDNKAWVDNLALLLAGIAAGFALVSLALGVYAVVTGIATAVSTAFAAVMAFIASPFFLIALAIGVVIAIGLLLWKNWDWLGQQAQNLWNWIVGVFNIAVEWIKQLFTNFINFVVSSFNFFINLWAGIWAWLTASPQEWAYRLGFLIGSVIKFFIDSWNSLVAFSNFIWDSIKNFAIMAFFAIIAFIITLPGLINAYFNLAKDFAMQALSAIGAWGVARFNDILNFVIGLPEAINNQLNNAKNWAIDRFNEIKDGAIKAFDFIKNIDLLEVGKNIVQGLIDGISSMAKSVSDTVSGIADNISKGFKDAMGINSPSKVMFEYGKFTGEGLSLGMDSSIKDIAQSSSNMAMATTAPLAQNTNTVNQSNNFNISGTQNPQGIVQEVVRYLSRSNNLANSGVGQSI